MVRRWLIVGAGISELQNYAIRYMLWWLCP